MPLDKHQQSVLDAVVRFSRHPYAQEFHVSGRAGVGKTTLIAELARELECPVLAPTNKAAAVLRSKGIIAQTAHSYLYIPQPRGTPEQIKEAKLRLSLTKPGTPEYEVAQQDVKDLKHITWVLKAREEADPIAIVDESSMIAHGLGDDLCTVLPQVAAFGDPWQLPPVNARSWFKGDPDAELTKVYRQGRGSGILDMAFTAYTTGRAETYSSDARALSGFKLTRDRYVTRLLQADKVLVGTHFTRRLLNHVLRWERELPPVPIAGDTLTCVRSPDRDEREAGLVNGYTYTVKEVRELDHGATLRLLLIDVLSGEVVKLNLSVRPFLAASLPLKSGFKMDADEGPALDFDYAVTVHKYQGSEAPHVFVQDESYVFGSHRKRWLYTAITRARDRVIVMNGRPELKAPPRSYTRDYID